jgi:hypothetical protein
MGAILCSHEVALAGGAGEEPPDKSHYNLFNPTPANLLREMDTDRPDLTEAPTTVDAGHFQLEMDLATFAHDQTSGVHTDTWNIAPFNLRIGLLNNVDLSLIFESYVHERIHDQPAQRTFTLAGAGDFVTRVKINLWGNDGGSTAFAIFPFVKFPTNTGGLGNDAVEGGVLFPFSASLPAKIDMGMETGVGLLQNESGSSYHEEFLNSITFGREIAGKLRGYVEFFSVVSTERDSGWVGSCDFGLTYALTENLKVDCGCNVGLTSAADDIKVFTGISARF